MKQLHIQAPVYGSSGYAAAAREFCLALAQEPIALSLEPLRWRSGFDIQESRERYQSLRALEGPAPPESTLLHWSIASEFQGRQGLFKRALGHSIFETNRLIQSFVKGCNRLDGLIVPTAFHQQAFQDSGVKVPIAIIPEGVDCQRFQPQGRRLKAIAKDRFTFLFVAQLSYRKGFDLVLKAFLDLFANQHDVQLVMRCSIKDDSPQDFEQVADFIQNFCQQYHPRPRLKNIALLTPVADLHLPALYRSAEVLLAPFRGEGWGLPIIEALATELPVIATGWGGPMAYLNSEIAELLPYELQTIPEQVPAEMLGQHLIEAREEGHLLAEPSLEALKYAMEASYHNYLLAKAKAVAGRDYLAAHWSWQQAAQQFVKWIDTDD